MKQEEKTQVLNGKHIYTIDTPRGPRVVVETHNNEPSQTEQQFKDDADVNHIMRRYNSNPHTYDPFVRKDGIYADTSQIPDLVNAMETVVKAQHAFDELPSQLRERFGNSPVMLLEFLKDPKNTKEAIELGLMEEIHPPQPIKVEISNPIPSPTTSEKK